MSILRSMALLVCLTLAGPVAQAAAYKCTDANGSITFSDLPCPTAAAKDEKILGRGAGSNPLTAEEKAAFKRGALSRCPKERFLCNCVAETLADELTYEEIMQTLKSNGRYSTTVADKQERAIKNCSKMAAVR